MLHFTFGGVGRGEGEGDSLIHKIFHRGENLAKLIRVKNSPNKQTNKQSNKQSINKQTNKQTRRIY